MGVGTGRTSSTGTSYSRGPLSFDQAPTSLQPVCLGRSSYVLTDFHVPLATNEYCHSSLSTMGLWKDRRTTSVKIPTFDETYVGFLKPFNTGI